MDGAIENSPADRKASNAAARRRSTAGPARGTFRSSSHRQMMAWLERIAPTELPVLIRGETGSGKERVSRLIHRLGRRPDGPFVAVNCAAMTETLLEAELFGAVRGAYTGADRDRPGLFRRADGGTLFLDEVGEMQTAMQAKLLRALDSGRVRPVGGTTETAVDVRIVAATHRDLDRLVRRGRFRADLFHRLAVLLVDVPPLRARLDDLPAIVASLEPRLRREVGCRSVRLTADAWPVLRAQLWPGNVRQLHAALARALLRSGGGPLGPEHLDLPPLAAAPCASGAPLEQHMVENALRETGGNVAGAASRIGWTRQKLYRRMEALGIRRGPHRAPDTQERGGTRSSDSSTFQ